LPQPVVLLLTGNERRVHQQEDAQGDAMPGQRRGGGVEPVDRQALVQLLERARMRRFKSHRHFERRLAGGVGAEGVVKSPGAIADQRRM
jgi:hypothetical protein